MQVPLSQILADQPFHFVLLSGADQVERMISGISSDSRQVREGNLFVAVSGESVDGHRFIPQALERGAGAICGTQPLRELPVPYVQVVDSRQALAHLSAGFYSHPARRLTMIGVTGTDGKTTTANLIHKILITAGVRAGMITTVNAVIGGQELDTGFHVTTPDAPEVQRFLSLMAEAGLTHVVLETTSHGWAQHRVDACEFDIGVVTNITHEHLDYHGTYESYRAAKARLFTGLADTLPKIHGNPRLAVLNRDDHSFEFLYALSQELQVNCISYGFHPQANLRAVQAGYEQGKQRFQAIGLGIDLPVWTNLLGEYNISNCLAALAVTVTGLGITPSAAMKGIGDLAGVPGRMERINMGQEFIAIVDFAHTPNALRCALETARQMAHGRVIAVFGSAGARDRQKRCLMAELSAELADLTILTAEDPRGESLEEILEEMAQGVLNKGGVEGQTFVRIPDRGEALRFAVIQADRGDLVIACGKGHEQSMCFAEVEYPWDDRTALRAAICERLGIPGPEMPRLPTST